MKAGWINMMYKTVEPFVPRILTMEFDLIYIDDPKSIFCDE